MHNFVGNAVNGTLHSWALSFNGWDNLLWFYGIVFLYIGYKIFKYLGESVEELAESEEAGGELLSDIAEWFVAITPLALVFIIGWYRLYG